MKYSFLHWLTEQFTLNTAEQLICYETVQILSLWTEKTAMSLMYTDIEKLFKNLRKNLYLLKDFQKVSSVLQY